VLVHVLEEAFLDKPGGSDQDGLDNAAGGGSRATSWVRIRGVQGMEGPPPPHSPPPGRGPGGGAGPEVDVLPNGSYDGVVEAVQCLVPAHGGGPLLPRYALFNLGHRQRHAGRDQAHVREALLHHHGREVRLGGRVAGRLDELARQAVPPRLGQLKLAVQVKLQLRRRERGAGRPSPGARWVRCVSALVPPSPCPPGVWTSTTVWALGLRAGGEAYRVGGPHLDVLVLHYIDTLES